MEDKRERNTDKLATEVMNKLAETEILPSCLPKNYRSFFRRVLEKEKEKKMIDQKAIVRASKDAQKKINNLLIHILSRVTDEELDSAFSAIMAEEHKEDNILLLVDEVHKEEKEGSETA